MEDEGPSPERFAWIHCICATKFVWWACNSCFRLKNKMFKKSNWLCFIRSIINRNLPKKYSYEYISYHMSTGLSSSPWHLMRDLLCLGNKKGWCDAIGRSQGRSNSVDHKWVIRIRMWISCNASLFFHLI